ncbi:carbohydrate ABC transporter permease, partial [Salinispira pacifica]
SFKTQSEITNEPYSLPGHVKLSENLRWMFVRDETPVSEKSFAQEFGLKTPIGANKKVAELARNEYQQKAMFDYIGSRIRVGNIVMAVKRGNLLRNLVATAIVVAGSVAVLSFLGGMAGYPLAKLRYRWFGFVLAYFFAGLTLPRMLALVPLYRMMVGIGLLDNPLSLILIYGASRMSITIVVFSTFYKAIPADLEDASAMDGLGRVGYYFRILLRMSQIPILTVFVVSGTFVYNDFLTPLLFMTNMEFTHIQVALAQFVGAQSWFFGPIFAGVTIATIPMILVYLLLNRHFVSGVTAGAVKG